MQQGRRDTLKSSGCPISQKAIEKFETARADARPVFLTAAAGFGKSTLVNVCLHEPPAVFLSCRDSSSLSFPETGKTLRGGRMLPVVLDDLNLLTDPIRQERARKIAENPANYPVLISDASVPAWIGDIMERRDFLVIHEEDLALSDEVILSYFRENGVALSREDGKHFCAVCEGRAGYARRALPLLQAGNDVNKVTQELLPEKISRELGQYVIPEWDCDLQDAMMRLSCMDCFDLELASAVLVMDEKKTRMILRRAMRIGSFLSCSGELWQIEPLMRRALQAQADRELGRRTVLQCQYSAGLCYEKKNRMRGALTFYRSCGDVTRTAEVLMQGKHHCIWQGSDPLFQDAFSSLPESMIRKTPRFMAANARLCAEKQDYVQSNAWYEKLEAYAGEQQGGAQREALSQLVGLELTLPQRSSRQVLERIADLPEEFTERGIPLPEVSLSESYPSFLNGIRDFWPCEDLFWRGDVQKGLSLLFGASHDAVRSVIRAEFFAERAEDDCRAMTLSMSAWMRAQKTDPDTSFAAVACAARLNLFSGDPDRSLFLLDCMEKSAQEMEETQILTNLSALRADIHLIMGDLESAARWYESLPERSFQLSLICEELERTVYLLHVGRTEEAETLAGEILDTACLLGQPYLACRCELILSIARERLDRDWKSPLHSALIKMENYHFLRIAAGFGNAIYPLLLKAASDPAFEKDISGSRLRRIIAGARRFGAHYPHFLEESESEEKAVL